MSLRHPVRREGVYRGLMIQACDMCESREWVTSHVCQADKKDRCVWRMTRHKRTRHVTCEHVMSHVNTSCHMWTRHVTYEWVMFHTSHVPYEWVISRIRKSHVTHTHETCHMWTRDGTYKGVMSQTKKNRVTYERVMSRRNTCTCSTYDTQSIHIIVCCSVLQCVAVCCSVLQCAVMCCGMLLCVAVCCRVFQSVAVCCSVLQRHERTTNHSALQCVAAWCNMLSCVACVAVCCSVLQCVAVCCSVLQCPTTLARIHQRLLCILMIISIKKHPECKIIAGEHTHINHTLRQWRQYNTEDSAISWSFLWNNCTYAQ